MEVVLVVFVNRRVEDWKAVRYLYSSIVFARLRVHRNVRSYIRSIECIFMDLECNGFPSGLRLLVERPQTDSFRVMVFRVAEGPT